MRTILAMVIILAMVGCWNHKPGDPFEIHLVEELATICHAGEGAPTGRTMSFNRTKAGWHLKHHQFDMEGACYVPTLP